MKSCWIVERDGIPWRVEPSVTLEEGKANAERYAKAWNKMTRYKYTVKLWKRVEESEA